MCIKEARLWLKQALGLNTQKCMDTNSCKEETLMRLVSEIRGKQIMEKLTVSNFLLKVKKKSLPFGKRFTEKFLMSTIDQKTPSAKLSSIAPVR